jgi:hypothetical protein
MAKEKNVAETEAAPEPAPQQAPAQQVPQLRVDDSNILACYSNFCRVTGTPEELSIDFGFNPQPIGIPKDPIKVSQRIILNFFTAKRLLQALMLSIQRHEQVFGVLETDIQKRLRIPAQVT